MAAKKPQKPNSSNRPAKSRNDSNPKPAEETEDDSIIGKMFWRSLALIVVAGLVGSGIFALTRKNRDPLPEKKTSTIKPIERPALTVEIPEIPFSDITQQSGIHFVHFNGMDTERLLPETMGGGGGFFDYDNDGDQDILFVSSTRWPWSSNGNPPANTCSLYQNDGHGNFKEVTEGSGLTGSFYGMGPAFGDFNNDGWVDIFVTAVGLNRLYRNDQGKFTEVSGELGVQGSPDQWSCPSAWFDYDRDGKLDLIVGNYIKWSREIDLSLASTLLGGTTRGYGQPTNFSGAHMLLYHNDGDKFTEVGEAAGLHVENIENHVPKAKSLGIALMDVNRDGWLDVCVANDTVANFLFINKKNGTFTEEASRNGLALNRDGLATGAMGIDGAYLCNDQRFAVGIGNFANEPSSLYISEEEGTFSDMASATGFGPQTKIRLTFGLFFGDMDLDGNQDIVCANGHLEPDIQKVQPTQTFKQPPQLFWNRGKAQLVLLDESKTGPAFQEPIVGRGASYADIDGDGDLDVLLIANGGPAKLLRNDQKLGNHWLRVVLKDKQNTGAIGATLSMKLDNTTLTRTISPTRGYLSQTELVSTFGLGKRTPENLDIIWPDGTKQTIPIDKLDTTLVVQQPG